MTPHTTDSPIALASDAASAPSATSTIPPPPNPERADESYWRVARLCAPRLLNLLRIEGPGLPESRVARSPTAVEQLHQRLQAALALVLLDEYDATGSDGTGWRPEVFHALLDWQFTMRYDGVPRARHLRDHQSVPAMADLVVQIVTEARAYRSAQLLADIAAHLEWLIGRRPGTPIQEAAVQCAVVDGAVLVRRKNMLDGARRRLARLLAEQHPAGWFATLTGWNITEHVEMMDRLARLADALEWDELRPALERGLTLIERLGDGSGTIIGPAGTGWHTSLSPLAPEWLAPRFSVAARLVQSVRKASSTITAPMLGSLLDRTITLLATRSARAASRATTTTDCAPFPAGEPPHLTGALQAHVGEDGLVHYAGEGFRVLVSIRHGGALRVDWFDERASLEDMGVNVVQAGRTIVSGEWNCVEHCQFHASGLTIRGWLFDPHRYRPRPLRPNLGVITNSISRADGNGPIASRLWLGRPPARAGRFHRQIRWRSGTLTITDTVDCRRTFELMSIRQFFSQAATGQITAPPLSQSAVLENARVGRIRRTFDIGSLKTPEASARSR